jgi:hypothetical protein
MQRVIVTIGAGDIGELVKPLKEAFNEKVFSWTNIRLVLMFALVVFLYSFHFKKK